MNKDMHHIYETYKGTSATQEIIQEGLFDRLKARGAQAVGAVKGLGNQAAGTVKGAVAGATGNVAGVEAATKQRVAGSVQGELAKARSYKQTAVTKITNSINDVIKDLEKLGFKPNEGLSEFAQGVEKYFNASFDDLISRIEQKGGVQPSAAGEDSEDEDCDEMVDGVKTRAGLESQVKPTKFFP